MSIRVSVTASGLPFLSLMKHEKRWLMKTRWWTNLTEGFAGYFSRNNHFIERCKDASNHNEIQKTDTLILSSSVSSPKWVKITFSKWKSLVFVSICLTKSFCVCVCVCFVCVVLWSGLDPSWVNVIFAVWSRGTSRPLFSSPEKLPGWDVWIVWGLSFPLLHDAIILQINPGRDLLNHNIPHSCLVSNDSSLRFQFAWIPHGFTLATNYCKIITLFEIGPLSNGQHCLAQMLTLLQILFCSIPYVHRLTSFFG